MKKYMFMVSLFLLGGCTDYDPHFAATPADGKDGSSCNVTVESNGSTVNCTNGTTAFIPNGTAGSQGPTGNSGTNGHSTVASLVTATVAQCANGGSVFLTGLDINDNLVLDISDSNIQSTVICNGLDGVTPTTPPLEIAQILNPCGSNGSYDEVLLRFQSPTGYFVLSSFSDNTAGNYTRFSILIPGASYQTTDHSGACYFKVDVNGNLYDEHL